MLGSLNQRIVSVLSMLGIVLVWAMSYPSPVVVVPLFVAECYVF